VLPVTETFQEKARVDLEDGEMKKLGWVIFLFPWALLCSSDGLEAGTIFQQVGVASSPNPVGSGARAMGMGGAFIAIADDATAASWNPAGLIQLETPELSLVGAYYDRSEDFSSDLHPEIENTGKADDLNINYFSMTYPFRFHRNMVVSLNYQRLYEFERSFDYLYDYSPLGVNLLQDKKFDQSGSLSALGLAYAVEILPQLSLGGTLNIWTDDLFWNNGWDETFSERAVGRQGETPVLINTQITDKYSDFHGVNANFGLLWNVTPSFTVGAVVKTPFQASIHHQFDFSQSTTLGPPAGTTLNSRQSMEENVKLNMPLSYGMGLAWRVSDALSFDLDVYRTDWSDYTLKDSRGNKFSPIDGRPEEDSDVKDTTQVRVGGEYLLILEKHNMVVPLRAGFFYDPEPSEGEVKDFFGIAVGSGIAYKKIVFDVAYQFRWGQDIDTGNLISTSEADVYQHSFLASVIFHF
jgi:long-subunit fatty acid transport protein